MGRSCRIDSLEQGFPNSQSILAVGAFRLDLRKFGINSPRLTNSVAMVATQPARRVAMAIARSKNPVAMVAARPTSPMAMAAARPTSPMAMAAARPTSPVAMVAARPTSPVATIATRYILSSMIVCVKRESLTDQKAAASHFSRPLMSFDPAAPMTLTCLRCG